MEICMKCPETDYWDCGDPEDICSQQATVNGQCHTVYVYRDPSDCEKVKVIPAGAEHCAPAGWIQAHEDEIATKSYEGIGGSCVVRVMIKDKKKLNKHETWQPFQVFARKSNNVCEAKLWPADCAAPAGWNFKGGMVVRVKAKSTGSGGCNIHMYADDC